MAGLMVSLKRRSRWFFAVAALAIVLVVGTADYLTGIEISFSVFYLLAVALAVWFVGTTFGVLISMLSVATWLAGDLAAGAHYSHPFVPVWNTAITLAFYLVAVWLMARVRTLQKELEERVRQRTSALTNEMAERERLEREILDVGERERRRIGHDFHDSLGQHLTATAMAGQVLQEKLAAKSLAEAGDASGLVQMVEQAIELNRQLALGLSPVEMTGEGLMDGLRALASGIQERSKIRCDFVCDDPVLIDDPATAMHLYRIAQEATNNAVKHAKASRIILRLSHDNGGVTLDVQDNGVGLPHPLPKSGGMGLRIMGHRAGMIRASFAVLPGTEGGTLVTCTLREKP
jgi:signal transduction histidine kinase